MGLPVAPILDLVAASGATRVAVLVTGLDGRPLLEIEADTVVHAASTMKVPVIVELYRRVAAGELGLDDTLVVRTTFRSIADHGVYRLDPADDSETSLYGLEGSSVTLGELARLAIVASSNLATNLLVDLLGADRITATMAELGAPSLVVRRGVEDDAAWAAGLNNEVTARGLATVLGGIARSEVVSPEASAAILGILEDQRFSEGIPAGLPAGTRVAHKTGSITRLYHDAGVVLPAGASPYVLVVLTTGLDEHVAGPALVAGVSRAVHGMLTASPT